MPDWDSYDVVTSAAGDDMLMIRDVSDNAVVAAGKLKQISESDLLGSLLAGVSPASIGAAAEGDLTAETARAEAAEAALAGSTVTVAAATGTAATDRAAIQAALLSFGTLGGASQGEGGKVTLAGNYTVDKPVIVPSAVDFDGLGSAQITLATGSDCDVVQFATAGSAAQAAILGVSADGIANAFYASVRNLDIHGDSFSTTVPGYRHGISCITNPLTSAAAGDPDFDPMPTVENVRIKACTGDGYHHEGRSGAFLKRVTVQNCNGIGFVPSFDTTMIDCLSVNNQAGGYFNHGSNVGAACKFYNNIDMQWVSGTAYTAGNVVVSAGLMYFCISDVTSATAPASDATHWTELTDATAPQANGWDWYWDTGAAAHCWTAVESQEPSKGSFYFKGPNAGTIQISGQSSDVNFDNGQAGYDSANPDHYAAVVLDGVSNVLVTLNSTTQGGGSGYICQSLNSPGTNTLIAVTDSTETDVFDGDMPTFALVNGTILNGAGAGGGSAAYSTAEPLASGEVIVPRYAITDQDRSFGTSLALSAWTAATSGTADTVTVWTGQTAGSGLTYAAVGVYSVDSGGNITLLADTGDVSATAFGSTDTEYDLPLTSNFTRVAGQRYAVGLLVLGTTIPTFYVATSGVAAPAGIVSGKLPWSGEFVGGSTYSALPSSVSYTDMWGGGTGPAAAVSP